MFADVLCCSCIEEYVVKLDATVLFDKKNKKKKDGSTRRLNRPDSRCEAPPTQLDRKELQEKTFRRNNICLIVLLVPLLLTGI